MSYNFNNNKIYLNEELHINTWLQKRVILKRNNSVNKYAFDAIYNSKFLDIKDSSNFDKYGDFRFDVVSHHNYNKGEIINSSFKSTLEIKQYLLNINPSMKLGTLFQNVDYQSTKVEYRNEVWFFIIDLNVIRSSTFNNIELKVNDKRKYNLTDNYASAFICISKEEVKNKGAIIKCMKKR